VYLQAAVGEPLIKEQPPDEKPGAKGRILVMDDEAMIRSSRITNSTAFWGL